MMENLVQNNMTAISNMSDADKRDLQKSVNNEMQKMKIQEGDEKLKRIFVLHQLSSFVR